MPAQVVDFKAASEAERYSDDVSVIPYRCTKCNAMDRAAAEDRVAALNCWSCGAGKGMSIEDMHRNKVGMLPLRFA